MRAIFPHLQRIGRAVRQPYLAMMLAVPLLSGCLGGESVKPANQPAPAAGGSAVELLTQGGAWRVTRLAGNLPPKGAAPTLQLAGNQISGPTGCNRYFGPVTVTGAQLHLGPLGSTRMGCHTPLMAFETAFLAALAQVDGVRSDQSGVVLTAAGKPLVALAPAAAGKAR